MSTLNLYYRIKEAFEASTINTNHFAAVLDSIKWDSKFFADGEHYFCIGDMTLTTPSLNPFECKWEVSAIFDDGSVLSFN